MDYNTSREQLILPEYGRNIQKLIRHVVTIEDRNERNKAAQTIISVMGNMNPQLRDMSDFKHKLWDHMAIISELKIDIDSPYEKPSMNVFKEKPKKVPYNANDIRYKHYGKTIELMLEKASEYPEGEEKDILIKIIANHMKKSYLTWNREAITDESIFKDIRNMSKHRIHVKEDLKLVDSKEIVKNKRKRTTKKK